VAKRDNFSGCRLGISSNHGRTARLVIWVGLRHRGRESCRRRTRGRRETSVVHGSANGAPERRAAGIPSRSFPRGPIRSMTVSMGERRVRGFLSEITCQGLILAHFPSQRLLKEHPIHHGREKKKRMRSMPFKTGSLQVWSIAGTRHRTDDSLEPGFSGFSIGEVDINPRD